LADIEIRDLSYTYPRHGTSPPVQALASVSLRIPAGQYVAIVGANGSGKTTLGRHLNGLLIPTSGVVLVDGLDTRDPSQHISIRRRLGMVFQDPVDQIVGTAVEDDVAFGPENLGVPQAEMQALVREVLQQTGTLALRERPPNQLSAGQQQRVAMAAALAMRPTCLVLDEASSMLDPRGRLELLNLLDRLHQKGLTIITITHDMEEALRAERVVVLNEGRVASDGRPAQVLADPRVEEWSLEPPKLMQLTARLQELHPGITTVAEIEELASQLVEVWS
jgi:energy-coupling factor transporter ATPase